MGGQICEYDSICRHRLIMLSGVLECVPPVVEHGCQGERRWACVSPEGFAESVPRQLIVSHRHVQARDARNLLWLGGGGAVCQAESEGGRTAPARLGYVGVVLGDGLRRRAMPRGPWEGLARLRE